MSERNLGKEIDRILAVVPESEAELRADLEWSRTNATYKSPELQWECWGVTQEIMARHFGDHPNLNGWSGEALSIWSGKSVEQLREAFGE